MVRDDKDCSAVMLAATETEAQSEADRLNAEREARIMHGRNP
jgi:hypothetical protein